MPQAARCSASRWTRHGLQAARLSLGRLGVATSLDLRCEHARRRHLHILAASELGGRCDALRRAYRHLWALWALGSDDLAQAAWRTWATRPPPTRARTTARTGGRATGKEERCFKSRPANADEEARAPPRMAVRGGVRGRLPVLRLVREHTRGRRLAARPRARAQVHGSRRRGLLGSNARDDVVCVNLNWRLTAGGAAPRRDRGRAQSLAARGLPRGGVPGRVAPGLGTGRLRQHGSSRSEAPAPDLTAAAQCARVDIRRGDLPLSATYSLLRTSRCVVAARAED